MVLIPSAANVTPDDQRVRVIIRIITDMCTPGKTLVRFIIV